MKLRERTPKRRTDVVVQTNYRQYRAYLRADFEERCGYCGDKDWPRKEHFEIDHFVPKEIMKEIQETDYTNLVYACRSCNNAKRAKWPTGDEKLHNNGKQGWIDPCDDEYDKQFERLTDGSIKPLTEIGSWMYDSLKLWKKQHEILWNYEQLSIISAEMKESYNMCDEVDSLKKVIGLLYAQEGFLKKFYSNG